MCGRRVQTLQNRLNMGASDVARIRTIKPDFFLHEELAELSALHRLLFIGLWTLADKRGVLEDRPKRIKAALLPWEDCDVEALLADLDRGGFIVRYEAEGERCLYIPGFAKHQKPHPKEAEASLPLPGPDAFGREISRLAVERTDPAGKGFSSIPSSPAGKGREGVSFPSENGKGADPASPGAPTATDFARFAGDAWAEAFGSLATIPIGLELEGWYSGAISELAKLGQGDPALRHAYLAFLADDFWRSQRRKCPWSGWVKQWRDYLPAASAVEVSEFREVRDGEDPYAEDCA